MCLEFARRWGKQRAQLEGKWNAYLPPYINVKPVWGLSLFLPLLCPSLSFRSLLWDRMLR